MINSIELNSNKFICINDDTNRTKLTIGKTYINNDSSRRDKYGLWDYIKIYDDYNEVRWIHKNYFSTLEEHRDQVLKHILTI